MSNGVKLAKTKAEAEREKPVEIKPTTVAQTTNLGQVNLNLIKVLNETSRAEIEVAQSIGKIAGLNIASKETNIMEIFKTLRTGKTKMERELLDVSYDVLKQYNDFADALIGLNKYLIDMRRGKADGSELQQRTEKYFNSYNTYTEGLMKLRENIEEYTINTNSEYAMAVIDAALTIGTITGVGALVGGGIRAAAGGAIEGGIKLGFRELAEQGVAGAWKAVWNRGTVVANALFSGVTVGTEAWKQEEMNAALKKFEANPAEGIKAMDKFLLGVETTVAASDNKNKEKIIAMISDERVHLREMESKLNEPGHHMTFGDAAATFAVTFAVSMLFEAGMGMGKGITKTVKVREKAVKEAAAAKEAKAKAGAAPAAQETKAATTAREQSDLIRSKVDRKSTETEAGRLHQYLTKTTMPAEALVGFQEGKFGKALAEVGERYSGELGQAALTEGVTIDFKLITLDMKNTWLFGGMGKQNADVAINIYIKALRETAKQYDVTISMAKNSDEVYVFLAKDQDDKLFMNTVEERLDALKNGVKVTGASDAEKTEITSNLGKMSYETKDVGMTLSSNPKGEVSYSMQVSVKQEGKIVTKSGLKFDSALSEIELEANLSGLGKLETDVRAFISKFDSMEGENIAELEGSKYVTQARISFGDEEMIMLSQLTDKLGKGKMQVDSGEIGPSVLNNLSHPVVNKVEYAYYSALRKAIKDDNIIIGREKDAGPLSYAFETRDGSAIDAKKIEKAILEARKSFEAELKSRDIKVSLTNYSGTTHAEASSKAMGGMSQDQIDLGNKGVVLLRMHRDPPYWEKIIADKRVMEVVLSGEGLPKYVRNISDFMKYLTITKKVEVNPEAVFNAAELQKVNITCKLPEVTAKVM
jgi:hypothetical protein